MDNHKSVPQLKAIAKERSLGRYGTLIGANLIIFVIQLVISVVITIAIVPGYTILYQLINNIIGLIINILLGVLISGKAYLYMNLMYSQTVSASDIFYGLRKNPQKAVKIQALFAISEFILTKPYEILLMMYTNSRNEVMLSLAFIAMGVGLIILVLINLTYSQAFFILHDFPDKSAKEILTTSRHLMKGNKFRLFYLHVSFIPLYLLSCIALFVPLLWVSVYNYASTCSFYQDLIANAANPEPAPAANIQY